MPLKLFRCDTIPAPPYERGTHCISSTDRGFVLAKSEQEAERQIIKKFNLDLNEVKVNLFWIRRTKKTKEEITEKMQRICEQNEIFQRWLANV